MVIPTLQKVQIKCGIIVKLSHFLKDMSLYTVRNFPLLSCFISIERDLSLNV